MRPPFVWACTHHLRMPAPLPHRDGAHHDLAFFASTQVSAPVSRLMHRYVQLLFHHQPLDQRGQLWLGHRPAPLWQELGPLLQCLTLREGQAALLRTGFTVKQAYRDLWDSYGKALTSAQPPPPDLDFFTAAARPLPAASPASPSLSSSAANPWNARLDADHG